MTSTSIIFFPSSVLVVLLYIFTINSFLMAGVSSTRSYKEMEIIDDLPVKANMEKCLLALEKIVYFANSHRHYVNLNLQLGIFLTNVNLRSTLQMRGHRLSAQKRVRFERLLKTNDDMQTYFFTMLSKHILQLESYDDSSYRVANLCTNESSWPLHMKKFNIELLKKTKFYTRKELEAKYFKWPIYKNKIFTSDVEDPAAQESDTCLGLLSQNPYNDSPKLVHCQVPYLCAKLVLNGTHYGYGITHRILFLIMARFARGCALLTPAEDSDVLESLCTHVYNEAEFIAYHDFEIPDLFMEIVSLCTLDGHAQFLRRSWIEELLDYQTPHGCFNISRPMPSEEKANTPAYEKVNWQFTTADQSILGGSCNTHTTAVALGMLGAVLRYILENYY